MVRSISFRPKENMLKGLDYQYRGNYKIVKIYLQLWKILSFSESVRRWCSAIGYEPVRVPDTRHRPSRQLFFYEIGANRTYIKRPFLRQAMILGFVSGCLSIIALAGSLHLLYGFWPEVAHELIDIKQDIKLYVSMAVGGMFITWSSTLFAVSRFLRLKTETPEKMESGKSHHKWQRNAER